MNSEKNINEISRSPWQKTPLYTFIKLPCINWGCNLTVTKLYQNCMRFFKTYILFGKLSSANVFIVCIVRRIIVGCAVEIKLRIHFSSMTFNCIKTDFRSFSKNLYTVLYVVQIDFFFLCTVLDIRGCMYDIVRILTCLCRF